MGLLITALMGASAVACPLVLSIVFESFGQNISSVIAIGMLFFISGTFCW